MGLMIDMGTEKPVGELYQTPADDRDVCWLIGHFYTGTDVKLVRFQKPLEAPEPDSPMDRIYDLEDDHLLDAKWIKTIMEFILSEHGVDLGIGPVSANIAKWEAFIGGRDALLETDSPYLITNAELCQKVRGWKGKGESVGGDG